jgi:hypothetical protein
MFVIAEMTNKQFTFAVIVSRKHEKMAFVNKDVGKMLI